MPERKPYPLINDEIVVTTDKSKRELLEVNFDLKLPPRDESGRSTM